MSGRSRFARRTLLLAAGLAVGLVAAEGVVRVFAPVTVARIARDRVRLSEDPELLYELDPDHPEHVAPGLRAYAPPGPKGLPRLLVLGAHIQAAWPAQSLLW